MHPQVLPRSLFAVDLIHQKLDLCSELVSERLPFKLLREVLQLLGQRRENLHAAAGRGRQRRGRGRGRGRRQLMEAGRIVVCHRSWWCHRSRIVGDAGATELVV